MKEAIVTCAIGTKYLDFYNSNFRSSHEQFAKRINRPLIVIDDYIDKSSRGLERHPAWQKLLLFSAPQLKDYDRLCWIDADIFVTSQSKNPFDLVKESEWGAVRNNPDNYPDLAKSDLNLYQFCPKSGQPDYLLNTGFFIVSKKYHQKVLDFVYYNYHEQTCYENGPLSYHLLNTENGVELSRSYNEIIANLRLKEPLSIRQRLKTLFILNKVVKKSHFIHFAGGVNLQILETIKELDKNGLIFISKNIFKLIFNKFFSREVNNGF